MEKIKTVATHIPEDAHNDFRWAAKIAGHTVQQAVYAAIENYVAGIKTVLAEKNRLQ